MESEIIEFDNGVNYIEADFILTNALTFSKGCRNGNELVKKKKINQYIYARLVSGDYWNETDGKSTKYDKVLIDVDYIRSNKELMDDLNGKNKDTTPKMPCVLELEENEMFHDDEGNTFDVMTVGERNKDKIFFSVDDLSECFEMPNLKKSLADERGAYEEEDDYVFFMCQIVANDKKQTKKMFLTYRGLLNVASRSKSGIAYKFMDWAIETVFTVHLGTPEQKQNLTGKINGVDGNTAREVFNRSSRKTPAIYLLRTGLVSDLRDTFNISDNFSGNDVVYKFGLSSDLEKRIQQHSKTYGRMKNVSLSLSIFEYIDPQFLSTAETDLSHFFDGLDMKLDHDSYNELVVIPNNKFNIIKKQYKTISELYMGHLADVIRKMKEQDYENKIALLNKDLEIAKKNAEISNKNTELAQKDLIIKDMDTEIKSLKRRLKK